MKIIKTKFKDLILLKSKIHKDNRGFLKEVLRENIIKKKFVFDFISESKINVLRGLHLQKKNPQGKLITVLSGEIFDVAVDLRKSSKTFKKYFSIKINDKSDFSLYIPPEFAHGFLCLSNKALVHYKCTKYRNMKSEKTILWNDPDLKIKWPKTKIILSKKDFSGHYFKDII